MLAMLALYIYNTRWHSVSHIGGHVLGSNVAMVATGLGWVACTALVVASKLNHWQRFLEQVALLHLLASPTW